MRGCAFWRYSWGAMLKSDLAAALMKRKVGVTMKQAEAVIDAVFQAMRDALLAGENIEIRGLGAFHIRHYGPHRGRNPKTGESIEVPAKRGLHFRAGKDLKNRLNPPATAPNE